MLKNMAFNIKINLKKQMSYIFQAWPKCHTQPRNKVDISQNQGENSLHTHILQPANNNNEANPSFMK